MGASFNLLRISLILTSTYFKTYNFGKVIYIYTLPSFKVRITNTTGMIGFMRSEIIFSFCSFPLYILSSEFFLIWHNSNLCVKCQVTSLAPVWSFLSRILHAAALCEINGKPGNGSCLISVQYGEGRKKPGQWVRARQALLAIGGEFNILSVTLFQSLY